MPVPTMVGPVVDSVEEPADARDIEDTEDGAWLRGGAVGITG